MKILSRIIILSMITCLSACANPNSEQQQYNSYVTSLVPPHTPIPDAMASLSNEGFSCDENTLMRGDEVTCMKETNWIFYNEVEWVDLIADSSRSIVIEARTRPIGCYGFFCRYRGT